MHVAFRQELEILYIEDTEGHRIQAEEVEKLCRIHSLLREYRTQQQFSRFEWDEIERFVTKLERTQHSYAETSSSLAVSSGATTRCPRKPSPRRTLFGPHTLIDLVLLMGNYAGTAALLAAVDMQLHAGKQPLLPIPEHMAVAG